MIGAAFIGHPPNDTLSRITYHVETLGHPFLAGVTDFEMNGLTRVAAGFLCSVAADEHDGQRMPLHRYASLALGV